MRDLLGSWYTPWDVTNDRRFVMLRSAQIDAVVERSPLLVFERWWDAGRGDIPRCVCVAPHTVSVQSAGS